MKLSDVNLELSFPGQFGYEVIARDAIASFARCKGIDLARIEDLKTALSEACLNAIEYGIIHNTAIRVSVNCVYENNRLIIDIWDHGQQSKCNWESLRSLREKVAGAGPLRRIGWMLISELCDEAEYISLADGICFRLTFYHTPISSYSPALVSDVS